MIQILYPRTTNWFYAAFARQLCRELRLLDWDCDLFSVENLIATDQPSRCVMAVGFGDVLHEADTSDCKQELLSHMGRTETRVLVNFDCIATAWFEQALVEEALFTHIFDYGMERQLQGNKIHDMHYTWVSEGFAKSEFLDQKRSDGGRPLNWSIVGHRTPDRAAFTAAVQRNVPGPGFVYLPSLRPFNAQFGLSEAAISGVLARTRFYLWGSHHRHAYHECFRVTHALRYGAIPVKIDPLHFQKFPFPWVYPSISSFLASDLFQAPERWIGSLQQMLLERASIGEGFANALSGADVPRF